MYGIRQGGRRGKGIGGITARVIPDYERIEELHGEIPAEEDIYKIIWDQIKKVNRKLNNYKTVKNWRLSRTSLKRPAP